MDSQTPIPVSDGAQVKLRRGNTALVNGLVYVASDGVPVYNLGSIAFIRGDGKAPGCPAFDAVEVTDPKEAGDG